MIRAMDVEEDLTSMQEVLELITPLFSENSQISVTCRPGANDPLTDAIGWLPEGTLEADYREITEPFIGTVVERLLLNLPFMFGRTRLMRMQPKSCLSVHADPTRRYHYAITTNPGCYIVGVNDETGTFHHIPADGQLYEMDAHKMHTAMNSGNRDRIHLVICPADPTRPLDAEPIGRKNVVR